MSAPSPEIGDANQPKHVAIIMDGNGRWAKARGLPRSAGHKRGADAVRRTVDAAGQLGLEYLTLFAFSSENWNRPATEVDDLMGLFRIYLKKEINALDRAGVRLKFIGQRDRLAPDIVNLINDAEERTQHNVKLTFVLAINYGARGEILRASQALAQKIATGEIDAAAVSEQVFDGLLETQGIPDPDFIIRTSGEKRLSNFLLWQAAYAELIFMNVLWPDFKIDDLAQAIQEFQARERRYGVALG